MSLGSLALVVLMGMVVLAVLVTLTWLTFPAAAVVRTLVQPDPARFVRQALGRDAVVRDLGDTFEAQVDRGTQRIRVTWSPTWTEIQVLGAQDPPPQEPARTGARDQLARIGELRQLDPLIWRAFRPPDPQLSRAVTAARIAAGP